MYACVYVYLLCFCSSLYIYFNFREARKERWSAHDTTIAHLDLIVCVVFRRSVRLRSLLRSLCVRARSYVCVFVAPYLYLIGWSELTPLTLRWPYLFSYWNQQCEESTRATEKKTHILKRNRTQKKNCKYWRERKKTPKREEKTIGLVWTLWTLTLNSRHLEKYIKAAHSLMK